MEQHDIEREARNALKSYLSELTDRYLPDAMAEEIDEALQEENSFYSEDEWGEYEIDEKAKDLAYEKIKNHITAMANMILAEMG